MLIQHPRGHYRFLQGIAPYSCGVAANQGYEIQHVTFHAPISWRKGFQAIADFLTEHGLDRSALCAVQLRCPSPFTMDGFQDFNSQYQQVLDDWGLHVGDVNPIARTNVAPVDDPPEATQLYAFSYVRPSPASQPTFVVAGAGELVEGILEESRIIRRGETSPEAIIDKAEYVMSVMSQRLAGLQCHWSQANRTNIYTVHPADDVVKQVILPQLAAAAIHGVHRFATRPPVREIEFEMDVRGVHSEQWL